jgi:CYTH domain-containing protein
MNNYREVVLTGGPRSGKSAICAAVAKYFTPLGMEVWAPIRSRRLVLDSGIGDNRLARQLALDLQLATRDGYRRAAAQLERPVLIVYEGGEGELKSLCQGPEWSAALAERGINEIETLFSYDLVLHLVSDDRVSDDLILNSWLGHPKLKMIAGPWPGRINKALSALQELVGLEEPVEYERKYLVHNRIDPQRDLPAGTKAIEISQTYLRSESDEQRVRSWRHGDAVLYFWTKKIGSGAARQEQEEIIGHDRYLELLKNRDPERETITKTRWCFRHDDRRCELDHFAERDLWILEVELDGPEDRFALPEFLDLSEVTDDPSYRNSELARSSGNRKRRGTRANAELVP